MPRFRQKQRVVDHPRQAMDAIVAALRPEHVEVGVYRHYVPSCGHCGQTGHYHDEGYLAAFLAAHVDCEDRYDADGKWLPEKKETGGER